METLLIHFNPARPEHATWSLVNNAGELTTMIASGSPKEAAPLANKHKTVVLLDNAAIHINTTQLPVKNRQKLLRAIPFALEEQLADDIDDLHFVAGKPLANGATPVAAIRHETLTNIIGVLNEAGIEPAAMIPDTLCLTANSKQWSILLYEKVLKVQLDTFKSGEYDINIIATLLTSNLEKKNGDKPEKIILFTPEDDPGINDHKELVDEVVSSISNCISDDIELINVSYNTHPLVVYSGQYNNAMPLNFLQGDYRPRQKDNIKWQRWRLTAALTTIFLCLHLGSASVQYFDLQKKNADLKSRINKIYKNTFPQSKRIVNARVQMEQKLNDLKGSSNSVSSGGVIELLASSASALSSEKNITLQSINYRNNNMDIELTGKNLQAIESLNKKLNTQNKIKAEITSSSSEKDIVKGNIRIQKVKS